MSDLTLNPDQHDALQELLRRALDLSADYDREVAELIQQTDFEPLEQERARRFYTKVIEILVAHGGGRHALDGVRAEVDRVMAERAAGASAQTSSIALHARHGLPERPVAPTRYYNNIAVPMTEGFVDIDELRPWEDNPRIELAMMEFRELRHAAPEPDELHELMQGQLATPEHLLAGSKAVEDPFKLAPLARSIARRGIERPVIVTDDGLVLDGNRRCAASLQALKRRDLDPEEVDRVRWVHVWKLDPDATDDQRDAVVNALNFEDELKQPWDEFIKARQVVERFDALVEQQRTRLATAELSVRATSELKKSVASHFAIETAEVTRYLGMVYWADQFQQYHEEQRVHDPAQVRYRTNKIFQWFYEINAGRDAAKLTRLIEADETLKGVVYDLMYDVLDAGTQVRDMHKVVADPVGATELTRAHRIAAEGTADAREEALEIVSDAITDVKRRASDKRRGKTALDEFLKTAVDRLGGIATDDWQTLDSDLLRDVVRVLGAAAGSAENLLRARGETIS